MRWILFRGIDEGTEEWVYGYYCESTAQFHKGKEHSIFDDKTISKYSIIPETVGQFTGLTDRNGTRIFEGDVVTGLFLFELSVNAVVTFQDGAFGLEWYRGNVKTFNAFTSICNVEYEVIGNVHDNPELLKGEGE